MTWLWNNIDHPTAPFGMLLGLFAAVGGFTTRRKRKAGLPPPYLTGWPSVLSIALLVVAGILGGLVIAPFRNP